MECALLNETRKVASFYGIIGDGEPYAEVGKGGVQAIHVVPVNGQGAHVPWLSVVKDGTLHRMVNCAHLANITFADDAPAEQASSG